MPLVYNNLVFTRNYQKLHKYVLSYSRILTAWFQI